MKAISVLVVLILFSPLGIAQVAFGIGDRAAITTQGSDGSNRAAACKIAKDAANKWAEGNIGLTFAYTYRTSISDCSCDQAPPVRAKKLCLVGTSNCDAYGESTEMITQPWICNVDGQINREKKM